MTDKPTEMAEKLRAWQGDMPDDLKRDLAEAAALLEARVSPQAVTDAMIEAGLDALFPYKWSSSDEQDRKMLAEIFAAMSALSNSVSPQAGEVERAREIIAKHFGAAPDEVTGLVDTCSPLWCAVLEALSTVPVRPE